jgi:hypothetical protein
MRWVEPDTIALALLTGALLLSGSACPGTEASPLRMQIAEQMDAAAEVFPDGWIRQFDLKREQTIERLNGRMDELRRKLQRRERSSRIRLAAHA